MAMRLALGGLWETSLYKEGNMCSGDKERTALELVDASVPACQLCDRM